ncbi:MAG: hypothetical protein ACREFL_12015 [Stellaceae bacterium]
MKKNREESMNIRADARPHAPTAVQREWLKRGLDQPGGKLPLFDRFGQHVDPRTVCAAIEQGWAEPWYPNPLKPDWLVCKLTPLGREVATRPVLEDVHHSARIFSLVR